MVTASETIARLQARIESLEEKLKERSLLLQRLLEEHPESADRHAPARLHIDESDVFGLSSEETTKFTPASVIDAMNGVWRDAARSLGRLRRG